MRGSRRAATGPGSQAWREVQGATLRYIADEAGAEGKNAARATPPAVRSSRSQA
jgi:hypothetical protein